jgi:hypothetical protein
MSNAVWRADLFGANDTGTGPGGLFCGGSARIVIIRLTGQFFKCRHAAIDTGVKSASVDTAQNAPCRTAVVLVRHHQKITGDSRDDYRQNPGANRIQESGFLSDSVDQFVHGRLRPLLFIQPL